MGKVVKQRRKGLLPLIIIFLLLFLCSCSQSSFQQSENDLDESVSRETQKVTREESATRIYSTAGSPASVLSVHFIDVGQGDAILAICGSEAMLVDGGNSNRSNVIYTYLKQQGIDHLKYIICTHPDEDHVGGLAGALNYAKVDHAYCSEKEYDSRAFKSFLKYLDKQGVALEIPAPQTQLSIGKATGTIVGPLSENDGSNDNSIVVKLQLGDISFLLTGDAEDAEENELIAAGGLESTVLKVSHHGSNNSTSNIFLNAVKPQYAIVSCGQFNEYGHPADGLLNRLKDHNVQVYRTDMQGDIICTTDGKTISITTEKNPEADTFLTYHDLYGEEETSPPSIGTRSQELQTNETEHEYILNTRSKKFHWPDCKSVNQMSDNNKQFFTGMREELIEMGYEPCGNCHP